MEEEIWKDIVGYEGLYQVSNYSNVKSLNYNRTGKEKIMMPQYDGKGKYLLIGLRKNGKRTFELLHRIVAMSFVERPDNLKKIPFEELVVDHIDTNTHNNKLENLRWTDHKGNHMNELTRQHMSEAKKGTKHTEEWKIKHSERMKGENNPFYGKHHTEESKKKISTTKKTK